MSTSNTPSSSPHGKLRKGLAIASLGFGIWGTGVLRLAIRRGQRSAD
jgi:hypothetical protein